MTQQDLTPFYITGGTMPRNAVSYVARQADEILFACLKEGLLCYVLTPRQMGKSSLMVRTADRLVRGGVQVALVDLSAVGQNLSVGQWYDGMLHEIASQRRLEDPIDDFLSAHADLPPLERWLRALRDVILPGIDGPLVLFIDEIDMVRSLPFPTDEFFAGVRACYNQRDRTPILRRLTFCLLGVASPSDLIDNVNITPFNIGRRIELDDFTLTEASALAPGIDISGRDGKALLARVLTWTGGHPYLTQRLCAAVASDTAVLGNEEVDRLCQELFLTRKAQDADDNLAIVRNRLLKDGGDLAALLELYGRVRTGRRVPDEETNPLCSVLKLSGIARVEGGLLRVRNRIYGQVFDRNWVQSNLPGAEVRRQQRAFRRGLALAGAVSGMVLTLIGVLAWMAVMNAQTAHDRFTQLQKALSEAQAQRATAERVSYLSAMDLAQREYENNNVGHTLDLLEETRANPNRGIEWGYWNRLTHLYRLTLTGHTDFLTSVAFSPDGQRILTGSDDLTARVWDAVTGKEILTLTGHTDHVRSVAFSSDGKHLLTGSDDKTASVWDAVTGKEILTLRGHTGSVTSASFSPDGKRLLTGSGDHTVRLWDATTGKETLTLRGRTFQVNSVAFSPDGKRLLTGSDDKTASVWDAATGKETLTLRGHSDRVWSVVFSPDGKRIATGGADNTARVWDAATGKQTLTLAGSRGGVFGVAFSSDGRYILTACGDNTARVWDAATGKVTSALRGHTDSVTSAAFSPDGKRIVTASHDTTARVWDVAVQETLTLRGNAAVDRTNFSPATFSPAVFSPDGKRILTAITGRTAVVWDAATGQKILTLKGHTGYVTSVAFSPNGKRILTGTADAIDIADNTARVWDAATGQEILTLKGHTDYVTSVAFSPDGKRILTGTADAIDIADNTARVWDAATGQEILTLKGHTHYVTSVVFSPDGKRILTGSDDKTARVWDAVTGKLLLTLTGHTFHVRAVAFSLDGKRIVTGSRDHTARVWDAATGQEILTLKGHTDGVYSVAFSPDGRRILTASHDHTARLWDAATGEETLTLVGHADFVNSVAFSPDGRRLLTGSADGTAKVWFTE